MLIYPGLSDIVTKRSAKEKKMARGQARKKSNASTSAESQLVLERDLFLSADKLRKNLEPSDYKHVVLGLIFLRHISLAFEARHEALLKEDPAAAEDRDEYSGENIFWVPIEARWSFLQSNAPQPTIGKLIDEAMAAIEGETRR
jgi:type I restriction enzyme M protein